MEMSSALAIHRDELLTCTRCPAMYKPVVSGLPVVSRILLVGQAPGVKEPVLGRPFATDPAWVGEAARVVLPGLRVVGESVDPGAESIDLMASGGGVWVGTRRR